MYESLSPNYKYGIQKMRAFKQSHEYNSFVCVSDKRYMMQHLNNHEHTLFQVDYVPDCELFGTTPGVSKEVEGWVCEKAT